MSDNDTLDTIVAELLLAVSPLRTAVSSPAAFGALMRDLGWDIDVIIAPVAILGAVIDSAETLVESETRDTSVLASMVAQLQSLIGGIKDLSTIGTADVPASIDIDEFRNEFPEQLITYLVSDYLLRRRAGIGRLLQLVGVIRLRPIAATPTRLAYTHHEIAWADLARMLDDPGAVFRNAYQWGSPQFDGRTFLSVLYEWGRRMGLAFSADAADQLESQYIRRDGLPANTEKIHDLILRWHFSESLHTPPMIDAGLGLAVTPESATEMPGWVLFPYARGATTVSVDIRESLRASVQAGFSMLGGVALHVRPDEDPRLEIGFLDGALAAAASIAVQLRAATRDGAPLVLLGQAGGSRIETGAVTLAGGLRIQTGTTPEAFTEFAIDKAAFVLRLSGGADGFLSSLLPEESRLEFGTTVGFSSRNGMYFSGSASLEIQLPVHIAIGPLEIQSATISIRPAAQSIPIDLTATIKADLSVLKAVVENVGVRADLTMPPGGGRLGPFDFGMSFRPPKGVGLSVDAGPVKGGGYLYFDFDEGEYAGALELMFSDIVNLKVIGLITTKMPDGSPGFSLLLIITAEFGAGLQLGYGFKLIGVGGLLGLNRKVLIQPLTEGVRTGAVNNILFPKDVVANAPRIISDLRTIFPPEPNKFLIGPMAKIGWGTPTLITLSLGIIIEIPGNIAILGVLGLILPDLKSPVVVIQVAFVGAIEFDKKRVYFFAAMFDSRVLFITMAGEMGVLVAFGDNPDFVLSVGGFHPKFNPPPLPFPTPKRISLSILNESYGRILAETYFAVTTNTVQFGASASLFFGFSGFSVEGSIIFDALMRFSPFYFIIELKTTVSLKVFGSGIFSLDLEFALEGTSPWRARGQGTIRILLWDVHKSFDETWGERVNTVLLPLDVMGLLAAELKKIENWNATLAHGNTLLVSLRKLPDQPGVLVLHPLGSLRISQRSVPLGVTIDKVGNQKPSDARRFRIRETTGSFSKKGDVSEQFAPAQFQDMSDPEKLSRPSFEPLTGGMELSAQGAELTASRLVKRIVRYEQVIVDTNYKRLVSHLVVFVTTLFEHFLNGNAATLSTLSDHYKTQVKPNTDTIQMKPERYAVAFTHDNRAVQQKAAGFSSQAEAREFLSQQVADDPNVAATMHVIPAHELNAA